MKKKAINKKTWIIIGIVVVLLAVLGLGGYMVSRSSNSGREENMLELGQRYLDELDYEQAVVCFEAYLEIDPQSVEAYLGLAEAYEGLENYEKALAVLAEGYMVTGDARLEESSRRLQERYGEILAAEGSLGTDQQEASDLPSEGHLQEILVLDDTYESYGYAYGGSIPVKKNGMWGAINYDNKVIAPFEYTGFYAAPDELGNFVLYNSVFTEQSFGEITFTNESREYFLFDNQGHVLYQGEDEVRASGGMYITLHNGDDMSVLEYHSLDGTVLFFQENELGYAVINTFYDGISTINDSLGAGFGVIINGDEPLGPREGDVIPRIGTVDLQGNVSWHDDPSYYAAWDSFNESIIAARSAGSNSNSNINANVTGYSMYDPRTVLSTMNHGYYITGSYYIEPGFLGIYDSGYNQVASINYFEISVDGNDKISISENTYNESNAYRGFYVDGGYIWNHGSHMVFIVDGKNVLVDFAQNTGTETILSANEIVMAVYDYIAMADEDYWLVQSGEQWGYINHDGKEMAMFDDAGSFVNSYALVMENGEAWLLNGKFEKLENLGQADSVSAMGELYSVKVRDKVHLYQMQ